VLNVLNPTGSGSKTLFLAQDSRNKTKPRFACTYNTSICRSCHFFYFPDPDPALYVKTDLDSCGKIDADPLVRGMDPRIRIPIRLRRYRSLMSQIRNTACNHCRWSGSALFVRNNILSTGLLDPIFVHVTSVVDPDPLWLGSHGSESLLGMWVRIQEQGNWPILPVFQKRDVLIFESFWYILLMIQIFCDGLTCTRFEVKSWIRIRIETNADPGQCLC
jgi:hypothetical protein